MIIYTIIKRLIAVNGLTEELKKKIGTLYAVGSLTDEQFQELMGV